MGVTVTRGGSRRCPPGCSCGKHSPREFTDERRQRIGAGVRRAWAAGRYAFTTEVVERRNDAIRAAYAGSRKAAMRANMARSSVCEVCGDADRLVNDHDHKCCSQGCRDCYRGVLCSRCNVAVGMLRDNPELCERAAAYLTERSA